MKYAKMVIFGFWSEIFLWYNNENREKKAEGVAPENGYQSNNDDAENGGFYYGKGNN